MLTSNMSPTIIIQLAHISFDLSLFLSSPLPPPLPPACMQFLPKIISIFSSAKLCYYERFFFIYLSLSPHLRCSCIILIVYTYTCTLSSTQQCKLPSSPIHPDDAHTHLTGFPLNALPLLSAYQNLIQFISVFRFHLHLISKSKHLFSSLPLVSTLFHLLLTLVTINHRLISIFSHILFPTLPPSNTHVHAQNENKKQRKGSYLSSLPIHTVSLLSCSVITTSNSHQFSVPVGGRQTVQHEFGQVSSADLVPTWDAPDQLTFL